MAITFSRPALVQLVGNTTITLSDHNRSPLSEDYERHENTRRTAKAIRRRYFIADKRLFSLSWDTLPEADENTVDGFAGVETMTQFFENNPEGVTMRIRNKNGTNREVQVHIVEFDRELLHRYTEDFYYNVSMSFEEI